MALKLSSRACALRALPHNPLPSRSLFGLSTENEIDGQAFSELSEDDVRRMTPKLGIVSFEVGKQSRCETFIAVSFLRFGKIGITISPYLI